MPSIAIKTSLPTKAFLFLIALERGYSSLKKGLVQVLRVLQNPFPFGDIKSPSLYVTPHFIVISRLRFTPFFTLLYPNTKGLGHY